RIEYLYVSLAHREFTSQPLRKRSQSRLGIPLALRKPPNPYPDTARIAPPAPVAATEGVPNRLLQSPNQGCGRPPKRNHPDPRTRRCSRPTLPDAPAAQPSRPHARLG